MTVQTAYPENCSQKKSAQREFVKKKKRRTSKNKKRSPRKTASTDEEKQEDDSDNEGDVLSEDELDDLREFSNEEGIVAFGNVLDASSAPTMKVISKIEEWICDVKEKCTYNGAERRSAESNREDLRNIVRHKQSKEYIATKIVVQDRMRKYLIGIYEKKKNESGGTRARKETPIALPVLNATASNRAVQRLKYIESIKNVDLKEPVPMYFTDDDDDASSNEEQ